MQLGEFSERIARDVAGRREAMVGELRQMVERLNAAPAGATPPAAATADSVRISAEARAAMNGLLPAPGEGRGVSPGQLIAAMRAVLTAGTPGAKAAAVESLGHLVRTLAANFPARNTSPFRGFPIDDQAAALVRVLAIPRPNEPPDVAAVVAMVRGLFIAGPDGAPPEAALQRAALAIFLAAARMESTLNPAAVPAAHYPQPAPAEFPAALLGHLVRPPGRRPRHEDDEDDDGDPSDPDFDESADGDDSPWQGGGAQTFV